VGRAQPSEASNTKVGLLRAWRHAQHRLLLTVRVTGPTTGCVPLGGRPGKNLASGDRSSWATGA
jgi:hypothetical protein